MSDTTMPWPHAIKSYNWYPPETVLQIPMGVFDQLVLLVRAGKRPSWTNDALLSGEKGLLIKAKTFYGLMEEAGFKSEVPHWMMEWEDWDEENPDWKPEKEKELEAEAEREEALVRAQGKVLQALRKLAPSNWEGHVDEWVTETLNNIAARVEVWLEKGDDGNRFTEALRRGLVASDLQNQIDRLAVDKGFGKNNRVALAVGTQLERKKISKWLRKVADGNLGSGDALRRAHGEKILKLARFVEEGAYLPPEDRPIRFEEVEDEG